MKKVSVIVPCYNAAMYLDKCVEHLLHQTIGIENIEIILVNDASTDNGATWRLITEYEQKYPDTVIAVMLEQNLRQGGARNAGLLYASGEYFIFCDADDWMVYEAIEHCYRAAKEHDADVVEFIIKNVESREEMPQLEVGEKSQLIELDSEELRKAYLMLITEELSFGSQAKLYRTDLVRENQIAFAEHLIFEEPSFVVPIRLYEKRHYYLDERLYISYLSQGSTIRSNWEKEHRWDNLQVWITLMDDLSAKGLFQKYHDELEYLFFRWGLILSLRALFQQGCDVSKEEYLFLTDVALTLFPDIRNNKYIDMVNDRSNAAVMALLDAEITDMIVPNINGVLRTYL